MAQEQKPSSPYPEPPPPYSAVPPHNLNYGVQPMQGGRSTHPPPPGGVPVFPMAGGYNMGPNTAQTLVVGQPAAGQVVSVVSIAQFGPYPLTVTCPHCSAHVLTETKHNPGLLTWLLSGALVFFGCWLGCCLIPCCVPECQDIEHRCPNCKHHLGTYRRL